MRNSYVVVDGKGSPTTQLSANTTAAVETRDAIIIDISSSEDRPQRDLSQSEPREKSSSSSSSSRPPEENRRILKNNTRLDNRGSESIGVDQQVHKKKLERRSTIEVKKRRVVLRLLGKEGSYSSSEDHQGANNSKRCNLKKMHPTLLMILVTALLTLSSTVLINVAILTDRWETVGFDKGKIEATLATRNLSRDAVQWLFEGRVGVFLMSSSSSSSAPMSMSMSTTSSVMAVSKSGKTSLGKSSNKVVAERSVTMRKSGDLVILTTDAAATGPSQQQLVTTEDAAVVSVSINGKAGNVYEKESTAAADALVPDIELTDSFFVPMHGGVWKMCTDLTASELEQLTHLGYWLKGCLHHMDPGTNQRSTSHRDDWAQRMQNLSISCAMVCLILLGASAVVGSVGVCKQEIPAVLVTGILYLLAAIFGVFTLTIMHFKRRTKRDFGVLDQHLSPAFYPAKTFESGWSYYVGWAGVGLCFLASVLWLVLARVMRFHILTASIS